MAPSAFGATVSAAEAAAAIGEGWRRAAPGDELTLVPLVDLGISDTGPAPDPVVASGSASPLGSAASGFAAPVELDAAFAAGPGLVVTGVGVFDWRSLRGSPLAAVARRAADHGVPCLVLATEVLVGRREAGAIGVDTSYAVSGQISGGEAVDPTPAGALAALAAHVASQWSR